MSFLLARARRVALAAAVLTLASSGALAAQAPDEDWRSMETEHFTVVYPEALRDLASRVADRAERAYRGLEANFAEPPGAAIHIVVTDHTDTSNGFARVSPWDRITIFAAPPLDGFDLTYYDDWVELVVTHELAHIFHLDQRGWLGDVTKAVFGRAPVRWPIFPNSALPSWTVEGLAVYYESSLTEAGRIRGTFNDMVLRTAVLEGRLESLYQVSGETQVWPAGNRPYIYGAKFFEHLVEEHGPERMGEFAEAVNGQIIPFRMNAAARKSFGVSFEDAYAAWADTLDARYADLEDELAYHGPITRTEPVAASGRFALHPRISPDGNTLAYSLSDGRVLPQIFLADPDGSNARSLVRSNGLGLLDWIPDGRLLYAEIEFVDRYRTYTDLRLVDPSTGESRRITRGARLDQPSVSPDGGTAVAIRQEAGRTWMVEVDLDSGEVRPLVEPSEGVQWAYPAVSPDGRWIAVARWEPGAYYDLVLLDRSGAEVARITRDRALDQAPTWSPDGTLLWASDRTGIANLFAVAVGPDGRPGPIRQVTNLPTGASYPDVDPAGDWLYFSAYHADGWHLERTPYDPAAWMAPAPMDPRFQDRRPDAAADYAQTLDAPERPYRPFPSLWPRYWEPTFTEGETWLGTEVLGNSYGIRVTGRDLVDRHAVTASLRFAPNGDRLDGGVGYSFYGFGNPSLGIAAQQSWSSGGFVVQDPVEEGQDTVTRNVFLVERERQVGGSVSFVRRRFTSSLSLTMGASYVWERRELLNDALEPDTVFVPSRPTSGLPQLSATVGFNTARTYAFSISPEDGISGFARVRGRWDATVPDSLAGTPGADATWSDVTSEVRLYKGLRLPGFSNHVLALRVSGGAAWDSGADAFFYSLGGASGEGERITGLELLSGNNLLFPVRGYDRGIRSGTRAWTASLEYRFPLFRVNQGLGSFPVYFDWISGSAFLDAGNAWGPELGRPGFQNPRGDPVASGGAELTLNGLPFWTTLTALRAGLAIPFVESDGARFYVRLGVAF